MTIVALIGVTVLMDAAAMVGAIVVVGDPGIIPLVNVSSLSLTILMLSLLSRLINVFAGTITGLLIADV